MCLSSFPAIEFEVKSMRAALFALCLIAPVAACGHFELTPTTPSPASDVRAIETLLRAQDAAWNRGDIDAFMRGYVHSPDLRFASGGTVTRGWDATNARYKTRYATPEKMGQLSTTDYEIDILSADAAVAHGRWSLDRAGDKPSGLYTLVLRKASGEWRIVSDTTTSAD
jgi:ketosteroid isomerase-like protein